MSDYKIKNIDEILDNVKATMAVEGLNITDNSIENGRDYLQGKKRSKDIIDGITKKFLIKNSKLTNDGIFKI